MTQRGVEIVLGRLATDEDVRRRFAELPATTLRELVERGVELSAVEITALQALDVVALERFAKALDRRLQKVLLVGAPSGEQD